jgi:mono/diheme cytochrome c family protein
MRPTLLRAVLALLPAPLAAAAPVDYSRDVQPLLRERCVACHGPLKQKGGLRLDAGSLVRRGGKHGPAVVPGQSAVSRLIARVADPDEATRMPPEGATLTAAQVDLLRAWIDAGAASPADEKPEPDPRDHWAFRLPRRPPLPAVGASCRNPIDIFLAAGRAKHEVVPTCLADKATLLRRVYLDLVGLPPTREELHAFLADSSTDAYEKVVDRLLASPQYGERWARHWMDVWRYSDWYGRRRVPDVMNSYPRIWRWRDWIVRSLNEDKGYDRMVVEMLAADEVAPEDDANVVATGFLVRNWFKWNYNVWMKDTVEHTGKAFLGLTLNCCHCHDHKYDPITQEEYFRFRAFFEPLELRHDRVPGEPDPGPFRKYVYLEVYGPIASGAVRVFDEKLDAQTFMYVKGDARHRMEGKPPVKPGAPAFLGGDRLKIEPVELPLAAWYPGSRPFVRQEERAKRQAAVAAAEAALAGGGPVAQARLTAARSQLAALQARIAADDARYGLRRTDLQSVPPKDGLQIRPAKSGDPAQLARAAARAERQAALDEALASEAQAEKALAAAKNPANERQLAAAKQAVASARTALAAASDQYTPLSPVYPNRSTGRRTALARWIANRDNPLTARVAVNHVWGWHFGRPLVETTADLGRKGARPSHPELLDWLACELMDNGWRFKHLHRLLVTSDAYCMGSSPSGETNRARDADNRWLWHFPVGRMEAEVVRDSVLHLAGELDTAVGGQEIPHEQGLAVRRRSLYFAHHGESKMDFLDLFDAANPCDCYRRSRSVLPQQALALVNSEFTLRQARLLARKLSARLGPAGESAFVQAAFEQVLGRPASAAEQAAALAFLDRQAALYRQGDLKGLPADGTPAVTASAAEPTLRARESLVHALYNHNDFVTIR